MPNTTFANRADFLNHIVKPIGLTDGRAERLYRSFFERGYLARQEPVGIGVKPRMQESGMFTSSMEGDPNVVGHHKLVMLSHPRWTEDEFDEWTVVVQGWAAALPFETRRSISRKVRLIRDVENGIPLTTLSDELPAGPLLTFRRPGDFVVVIDADAKGKTSIFTTREIG